MINLISKSGPAFIARAKELPVIDRNSYSIKNGDKLNQLKNLTIWYLLPQFAQDLLLFSSSVVIAALFMPLLIAVFVDKLGLIKTDTMLYKTIDKLLSLHMEKLSMLSSITRGR
jgi:hypothetical protein